MTKQSHYNVGIYVRLSQEDERAGESISIENQKKMLTEYVSKQTGWNLVEIYEDDGYSGTDFNHPGVQKLLDDARSGKINLILCKDLSRFGRNYIEVGQYVDYVFPSFNIRFIALSDNVDTQQHGYGHDADSQSFQRMARRQHLKENSCGHGVQCKAGQVSCSCCTVWLSCGRH